MFMIVIVKKNLEMGEVKEYYLLIKLYIEFMYIE
jgi:hypothetical protein